MKTIRMSLALPYTAGLVGSLWLGYQVSVQFRHAGRQREHFSARVCLGHRPQTYLSLAIPPIRRIAGLFQPRGFFTAVLGLARRELRCIRCFNPARLGFCAAAGRGFGRFQFLPACAERHPAGSPPDRARPHARPRAHGQPRQRARRISLARAWWERRWRRNSPRGATSVCRRSPSSTTTG